MRKWEIEKNNQINHNKKPTIASSRFGFSPSFISSSPTPLSLFILCWLDEVLESDDNNDDLVLLLFDDLLSTILPNKIK